jgi:hypothetical protein
MMTTRMVDMANQIAMSVPDRDRAAEETASHLVSFWSPAMIAALDAYAADHRDDLSAEVHDALAIWRERP